MEVRGSLRKTAELGVAVTAISVLILAGCGGGGGSTPAANNNGGGAAGSAATGVVYPVVAGLIYSTSSGSGVVAADGSYSYKVNENVTFSAGGTELNTVPAAAKVTPLPLGNDVASTNLLRLLKVLDTDQNLSNGVVLPTLPTASSAVDLASESSVVAALASLSPAATLPVASDAQVATTLTSAKTTALQNMGAYGTTYNTIIQGLRGGVTTQTYYPKDAKVSLTSPPDWTTGSMSGTATLTLNDNSQVTFTFNSSTGTYTALGKTQTYQFDKDWGAKSRIIYLHYGDSTCGATSVCGSLVLRDNAQSNMPPVAGTSSKTVTIALAPGGFDTYTWCSGWGGPGSVGSGSKDFDGIITALTLTSNKGKTVSMNLGVNTVGPACVSEIYYAGENPGVTVTVTDDNGATATKTFGSSSSGGTGAPAGTSTLTLAGTVNASLALTYDPASDSATVFGAGSFKMYDGSTSAVYQSHTNYFRAWSTNSAALKNATSTLMAGDTVFVGDFNVDQATGAVILGVRGFTCSTNNCTSSTAGTTVFELGTGTSAGGCLVGTGASPSCTSAGININRSAGTISFTNTPMVTGTVGPTGTAPVSGSATLNGTLNFTPF